MSGITGKTFHSVLSELARKILDNLNEATTFTSSREYLEKIVIGSISEFFEDRVSFLEFAILFIRDRGWGFGHDIASQAMEVLKAFVSYQREVNAQQTLSIADEIVHNSMYSEFAAEESSISGIVVRYFDGNGNVLNVNTITGEIKKYKGR